MSNYNALAQRIVKLGVGEWEIDTIPGPAYLTINDQLITRDISVGAQEQAFCNDWRVAGALIEKVVQLQMIRLSMRIAQATDVNYSLPLAICEACCEALTDDKGHAK